MKRVLMLGVAALGLVGCQQSPRPSATELPPLRQSFLGETLNLSGTASDWPAGQTAQIRLEQQAVGMVGEDGHFSVMAEVVPSYTRPAVEALLPLPTFAEQETCAPGTFATSDAAARVSWSADLLLFPSAPRSLAPQLSPVPPFPALRRSPEWGLSWDWDKPHPLLVYADRDVRLSGWKVCTGKYGTTWHAPGTWQQTFLVNVQLRRGWNDVTMTRREVGKETYTLTVEGSDPGSPVPWRYNGVPFSRP